MAEYKDIEFVFNRLMKNQSQELLKLFNDSNTGIGAVLRILKEFPHPVTAGKISEIMCVSEARVTVLLKKMQNRGYIVKERDDCDARITNVKLTPTGEATADTLKEILCHNIAEIIDALGMEKIKTYILLGDEINEVIKNRLPEPPKIT